MEVLPVEIKIDKSSLEKVIKEMNLFPLTKKVCKEYESELSKLVKRQDELERELKRLQEQHLKQLLDKDQAYEVSERVYVSRQIKEIDNEVQIINVIKEEIEEEKTALKIEFAPKFKDSIDADHITNIVGKYSANDIVDEFRYEMIMFVIELSLAMQSQYREVSGIVNSVIGDAAVNENYPRISNSFPSHYGMPSYGESMPYVISRNHLFLAREGQFPQDIKRPKRSEVNE